MKIRSRGLGRRELLMDLKEFTVAKEGGGILLKGVTHAPITWETTVTVGPEDVGSILRMVFKPAVLRLGLRWAFRRKSTPATTDGAEIPLRRRGTSALPAETSIRVMDGARARLDDEAPDSSPGESPAAAAGV